MKHNQFRGSGSSPFLALGLALATGAALLSQCALPTTSPEAPSWEVDFVLPLMNKVYPLEDIADDSTLVITGSGKFNISMNQDIAEQVVGDENLKVNGQEQLFSTRIGLMNIDSPGEEETSPIAMSDLFPDAALSAAVGLDKGLIPSVQIQDVGTADTLIIRDLQFSDYEYTTVDTGYIRITVVNDMVIPLGPPLTIRLVDKDDKGLTLDNIVAVRTFTDPILPGESASGKLSLAGQRISNEIQVQIFGQSGAGITGTVFQEADKESSFLVRTYISDMKVTAATSIVPVQVFADTSLVSIEDSTKVSRALISAGELSLDVVNGLAVDARVNVNSPDLVKNSVPFSLDFDLITEQDMAQSVDLTGYILGQSGGSILDEVRFYVNTTTIASNGIDSNPDTLARVFDADSISTQISLSTLTFNEVEGIVSETLVEITPVEQELNLDFPEGLEGISLTDVVFEMVMFNEVNTPVRLELSIKGWNDKGDTVTIPIDEELNVGNGPGYPDSTFIVLDKTGTNGVMPPSGDTIVDLINLLPDRIEVSGRAVVGDGVTEGSVHKDARIWGRVELSAPLTLSLPETDIDMDPTDLELDSDARKTLTEDIKGASLVLVTENHVPLGGEIFFYFGSDTTTIFTSPLLALPDSGKIVMRMPPVNAAGIVTGAVTDTLRFSLDEDDMQVFGNTPLYLAPRVHFPGTGDETVQVLPSDYIGVKAYISTTILINSNKDNK